MQSSRRDLLNDMAEHRPILKNNQNMFHPRFGLTPKTGIAFPTRGVLPVPCMSPVFHLSSPGRDQRQRISRFKAHYLSQPGEQSGLTH